MNTLIDALATTVLLILVILLISHLLNGSASEWLRSKVQASE
jgi:hypothetical protein